MTITHDEVEEARQFIEEQVGPVSAPANIDLAEVLTQIDV